MKYLNAKTEAYERFEILGRKALFTNAHINYASVPPMFYAYELRDTCDLSGEPCELKKHVQVNFLGTVIVRKPIDDTENGIILTEDDYQFLGGEGTFNWLVEDL